MATLIAERTDTELLDDLTWHAEPFQEADRARPDLEARTPDGRPYIKIEGKLWAALLPQQLTSYAADLRGRSGGGILGALVACRRTDEAARTMRRALGVTGSGPWRPDRYPCLVAFVVSWEAVLDALGKAPGELLQHEVAGLTELYHAVGGFHVEPLADVEDLIRWREREDDFVWLVDSVTRALTIEPRLAPMGTEPLEEEAEGLEPKGYRRRYVGRPIGDVVPCFSIGVRDPFQGHVTPIWMRFHHETPRYALVRKRLEASHLADKLVPSGWALWLPMDVPLNEDGELMVESLVEQAEAVIAVAYKSLE